jgi:serine O-acetyltransferase
MSSDQKNFDLDQVVSNLREARRAWRNSQSRTREPGGRELPAKEALADILFKIRGVLFPMRLGPHDLRQESEDYYIGYTLDAALNALLKQAILELSYQAKCDKSTVSHQYLEQHAYSIVKEFAAKLPDIRRLLDTDVLAAYLGDPAAKSVDEVLICYPGIEAMIHHRIAHQLYILGLSLIARIVSELAHAATGIDIHPGSRIDSGLFIDHGTGVVIGETAVIGKNVRIYQAVTLGAKRFDSDAEGKLLKGQPRHPIVEDDVIIYAGATILGRVIIGRGSTIGGNVWVTRNVPAYSHITQASLQHALTNSVTDQYLTP